MANDFDLVQRLDIITEICAGKRVLHLGCTNYPYTEGAISNDMLLHSALEKVSSDLWGLDADQAGIDILTANGSKQVIFGDLEKLEEVDLDDAFEVIVAGEIIEHLSNPGLFLSGVQRFMNRNSVLIVTTVNAYCAMRFFYYGVRGKRGKIEPVHPDHVAYYSYATLKLLIERHEMEISNFYFYDLGKEHRPHSRPVLNLLNDICVTLSRQWADGIIAICRLPQ
ncbi:MAG: methyltransferase domain-containing protein [Acidobacteriota bacterium]